MRVNQRGFPPMQARAIAALFALALGISACAYYDDYGAAMASRGVTAAPGS
jgi:hypothetical protein